MDLSSFLSGILDVKSNNHVNVMMKLNDGYSLLFEGSFNIRREGTLVFCSKDYVNSNFSPKKLEDLRSYLNKQKVESAQVDDCAMLAIKTGNGLTLETTFEQNDYESWELIDNGRTILSSECKTIIRY